MFVFFHIPMANINNIIRVHHSSFRVFVFAIAFLFFVDCLSERTYIHELISVSLSVSFLFDFADTHASTPSSQLPTATATSGQIEKREM